MAIHYYRTASIPGPAPLGYSMTRERKRSLWLAIGGLVLLNVAMPCAVYYSLEYLAKDMRPLDMYSFTSISMGASVLLYWPWRYYLLCRHNGERSAIAIRARSTILSPTMFSPLYADGPFGNVKEALRPPRPTLRQRLSWVLVRGDTFQWCLLLAILVGLVPSVLVWTGTFSNEASFVLLLLTYPTVFAAVGTGMLVVTMLSFYEQVRQPCRFSSVKKGRQFRPAVAYFWEDLTAVDGGGGYHVRQAFSQRFDSSVLFREMNTVVSLFIGISLIIYAACALVLTVVLATRHAYDVTRVVTTQLNSRGEADAAPAADGTRHTLVSRAYHPTRRALDDINLGANMVLFVLWSAGTAATAVRWARQYMMEEERRWRRKSLYHLTEADAVDWSEWPGEGTSGGGGGGGGSRTMVGQTPSRSFDVDDGVRLARPSIAKVSSAESCSAASPFSSPGPAAHVVVSPPDSLAPGTTTGEEKVAVLPTLSPTLAPSTPRRSLTRTVTRKSCTLNVEDV